MVIKKNKITLKNYGIPIIFCSLSQRTSRGMSEQKEVSEDEVPPTPMEREHVEESDEEEESLGEESFDVEDEDKAAVSEEEESEEETRKPAKKVANEKLVKRVMEYDVKEMYPEISVLTEKKKREWDYQNAETIRALWLESKTNALAEWKVKYSTIKKARKPSIEVRDTTAQALRLEHLKNKAETEKAAEEKDLRMIEKGRESPKFDEVKLPTNTTVEMRYKYTRNNPPVPGYYLQHFEQRKKPPFKSNGIGSRSCKPV